MRAVAWKKDFLELLDQTLLPETTRYLETRHIEEAFEAIQKLRVRGAPAIGITAAYGLYLGMRAAPSRSRTEFFQTLKEKIDYLAAARPTAVNLFWAMEEIRSKLEKLTDTNPDLLTQRLLDFAIELHDDDRQRCEAMARHGQQAVPQNARIVTHCNTGALATGGIGTAFGVIYQAHRSGKNIHVYADETRPVLQGARLTMFELAAANIPSQLICDSMAATLMRQKQVHLVILGGDRIAADGSVANKIGTYALAVAAKYHDVPFYVAAPLSTFDLAIASGSEIPIEVRNEDEIRRVFNKSLITLPDAQCWNPAFDVTPPELITGIITERGIIRPPYVENIRSTFAAFS
ncbi:MAG: S-methyl-5-thioribose-1-phosphate isomerase [Verrucomicrobia bacterium]|nr:S-methyl-5-thioribose-1-phosphate isomerase [Verrucomicrobiota bacterium]